MSTVPDLPKPPQFLYRYRPANENTLLEIQAGAVYLCPLTRLNDSEEGIFEQGDSDPEELRSILQKKAIEDGKPEFAILLHFLPDDAIRDIEQHGNKIGKKHLTARDTWGVACFTERMNNARMWKEYADNHQGLVIEYDFTHVPVGAIWKVLYSEKRGSTNLLKVLSSTQQGEFSDVLRYKSPKWSYEEEWRLLCDRQGLAQLAVPLVRMITGAKMDEATKQRVTHALTIHGRARLAQIVQHESDRFRLHDLVGGHRDIVFV
jgi:hypothetical protein